jgi:hypothetical protein
MKIISYIRGASVVEVGIKDDDGKISVRRFPKTMSDDDIRAVLNGKLISHKNEQPEQNQKKMPEAPTVPEPPVIPKERVSRQQMIDALEAAGVTDYDSRNRESLTAAYNRLKSGE